MVLILRLEEKRAAMEERVVSKERSLFRALLHPVECQGCHNGLACSRECNRRRFDRQVCRIDLEIANLITTDPFWPPRGHYMVDDRISLDGIGPGVRPDNRPMNVRSLGISVTSRCRRL
jgi:hypothetical protein